MIQMAIKVLIVDDSAFMRKVLSDIIHSDRELEVVGVARNGEEAIKKVQDLQPDVLTMDIEMPVMNGLDALAYLMSKSPIPVIMLSALTQEGATATIKALEYGAVDYISKPSGSISLDIDTKKDEILQKIKNASRVNVSRIKIIAKKSEKPKTDFKFKSGKKLIAIGSSTGGPQALISVIKEIPGGIPAPILMVQHMPKEFTPTFAQRLDSIGRLNVKEAAEGDRVEPGWGYLAPGDYHMELNNGSIKLNQGPKVHSVRPAVDITFDSIARNYEGRVMAVILTGMGADGSGGIVSLKEKGAYLVAQDKESCIVYGMPKAAYETGILDKVLPLEKIPGEIIKFLES